MEKQFLLENEVVSVMSDDDSIILTNQRILKNTRRTGKAYFISMHLQNISTIEIHSKSTPLLLLLGILGLIAGILTGNHEEGLAIVIIGFALALIVLYFFTKYHVVIIASNGGRKLQFKAKRMKREAVLDFVRKIDQAKSSAIIKTLNHETH